MLKRHFAEEEGEGHPVQLIISTNTMMASLQQYKSIKLQLIKLQFLLNSAGFL